MDHTQPGSQWVTRDPSWDSSCLISVLMPWRRRWSLFSACCQVMPNWWGPLIQAKAELWPKGGDWWVDSSLMELNKDKCPAHGKEEPFAVVQAGHWEILGQLCGQCPQWALAATRAKSTLGCMSRSPAVQGKGLFPFTQHLDYKYSTAVLSP